MIATCVSVESAKDPLEVPSAESLGELGSRPGGGNEDRSAASQFRERALGGKGVDGTFGEDNGVRFGLVHGQPEVALSLARAPSQSSESKKSSRLSDSERWAPSSDRQENSAYRCPAI